MTEPFPALIWDHLPGIFQALTTGLVAWGWWSLKRIFVSRADYLAARAERDAHAAKLSEAINKTLDRVNALELRINALPTEAMLHRLELRMEGLSGEQKSHCAQMDGMRESLGSITHQLDRIQEYLMERN